MPPEDEPSAVMLSAWWLPMPLLLQAGMNLFQSPGQQNWQVIWVLAGLALCQGLGLWRRAVAGVLAWLALECIALVWVNVALMDAPTPDFKGESQFNEGMAWMSFVLLGGVGGGLLAPLVEVLYRMAGAPPRPSSPPSAGDDVKEPVAHDGRKQP